MEDYYAILEISKNANLTEIKKSFRKLALQYHPDINKAANASSLFIKINTAYEILINVEKRAEYDKELFKKPNVANKSTKRETTYSDEFKEQYTSKNAERYSNMSYNEFENIIDNIISIGKEVSKVANNGCAWIAAIIFFPLGIIVVISNILHEDGKGFAIIIGLFLILLGYGSYSLATDKNN